MSEQSGDAASALVALGSGGRLISDAEGHVPEVPGLYAVFASQLVWFELGIGRVPDRRPLYVGKSESSLASRDIRTHFGDGRTGQSTVRRSFAALLRGPLRLSAIPRNPDRPERFANYGLRPEQDARLTAWMRKNLRLAVWAHAGDIPLGELERQLLDYWCPPLNLKNVLTPWRSKIKAARAAMAAEAKAWSAAAR